MLTTSFLWRGKSLISSSSKSLFITSCCCCCCCRLIWQLPPPPLASFSSTTPPPRHTKTAAAQILDIEAIHSRLRKLGVDEHTLRATLASPLHACRVHWPTVKLVLDEGFSAKQLQKLLNRRFFLIPHQKLLALLDLLKTLDITGQNAGRLLAGFGRLERYRVETFERKLGLLRSFGLEPNNIRRTIMVAPSIVSISNDTFRKRVAWLQDFGVDRKSTLRIVRRCPSFLCLGLEKRLQPKVDLLESMGVSRASIMKDFSTRPTFFKLSLATLARKVAFVEQLGFEKDALCFFRILCYLGSLSNETVLMRYNSLLARGLSPDEVRRIVATCPTVLNLCDATLSKKIDYLIEIMNLDIKEICRCPFSLCCSLEKRIMPRFELLTDAIQRGILKTGDKGFLGSGSSLKSILGLTDKKFHEWLFKKQRENTRREDHRRERKKGGGQNK